MPSRDRAADINDVAIAWATKAERGLSQTEQHDLDAWLADDTRHLGAFVRAQAAWIYAERASALGAMPEALHADPAPAATADRASATFISRRMLLGGGAIAASVAAVGLFWFDQPRIIESGVGEIRRLQLAGGTTITLDTDTRVAIAQGSNDRTLALARGKLFVEVVRGGNRPLVVDAAGLAMEMAEGAFSLEAIADLPLVALVTKGQLAVSQRDGVFGKTRRLSLGENRAVSLAAGALLSQADVRPIAQVQRDHLLAWRDGMLSFGGEALATAIRAFDRYGSVRIVIMDPELGRQKITGLFSANDPRGFAAAVAASFGGVVASQGDIVRIFARKMPSP